MNRVYLDNAATTPLAQEVAEAMIPIIQGQFGNPSSTHAYGRSTKGLIENARRAVANHIGAQPGEIVFTSGGTEADNMAIFGAIKDLGVKRIITTEIEHHAVGHSVEFAKDAFSVTLEYVRLDENGYVDMQHLEALLKDSDVKTLVSLMHANNEVANLIDLVEVGNLAHKYGAYFHSDTVQTMAHYAFNVKELPVDFITGAAHKFHGPKGIGFLYISNQVPIKSLIHGGSQERGLRGGTENVYGIIGLAKAMDLAFDHIEEHQKEVTALKAHMIAQLDTHFPGVGYNGGSGDLNNSLYTVLNVLLPKLNKPSMLLFKMDLMGVACSGGSACTSGSNTGSHVLRGIKSDETRPSIRFSFSRYTTKEDIDYAIDCLRKVYEQDVK